MTVVRVKGIKRFRSTKNGRWYAYHRKTGQRLVAEFGTSAFFEELRKLDDLAAVADAPRPGTFGMLAAHYRASGQFVSLAPRTRTDYQRVIDYLKPLDAMPLVQIDRPFVARVRDKAAERHGRRFGNYVRSVLSVVLGWGAERGFVADNAARGVKAIKRPKDAPRANRSWTEAERDAVLNSAPWHLKVPIALGMFTALRLGDVVALSRAAYDGTAIEWRTNKSGQRVWWPAPKALRDILDTAPRHDAVTLAVNSHGRPWTDSGFGGSFRKHLATLKAKGKIGEGLTFHGLRHTVGEILREEGFDTRTIADALGHSTEDMARHYSRGADLKPKMTAVVEVLDRRENARRTNAVKPKA